MKFLSEDLSRFIKFGLVGVLNTIINWILFILLNSMGVYYIISNIIAYSISTLNSYLWNSKWVFKYTGDNVNQTTFKFITLNIIGLVLNTIILFLLVDIIKLPKIIALIIATGVVMILNYFINKLWVFKK
ncbi:GtrA family protein [uncultured Clostridium sp.]|uniref:GtrA family protein n=1 Tax=uncultured Clostridium sp. TaxID=59620 RepID=UPI0025CE05A3|nr:GtrA family protein [uncultured Clostridium sp.]MDU4884552.1 GtrA family protein [Clostridium celatum]MDU7077721.1 GtrA family protein [Clostridium celatum]